jgi:hypothetical protein
MRYGRHKGHQGAHSSGLERRLNIDLTVPRTVHIHLVNASFLADYEAWLFLAALLANAVVGFLVAGITIRDVSSIIITAVFSIMFGIALKMAISKRRYLRDKTTSFRLGNR